MDDIDTRLEAERPEVADALRSMNWEERLEQARARRKTVLARNEAAEKRPVVRIIDASVVARRHADPNGAGNAILPAAPAEALPLEAAAAPASHAAADRGAEGAEGRARPSWAARIAIGFGLGLGLGTSLLAGAYLLYVLPGDAPPPEGEAGTAALAAIAPPTVASPAPSTPDEPAGTAAAAGPPSVAPAVAALSPPGLVAPAPSAEPAGVLPAAVTAVSTGEPRPALPEAAPAEAFRPPVAPPSVEIAASPEAPLAAPADWTAAQMPVSAPGHAPVRSVPAQVALLQTERPPAPAGLADPLRPAATYATVSLPQARAALTPPVIPGSPAPVTLGVLPASPGAAPDMDAPPSASLAPPAPPPPATAEEPAIPGAASLFVRLVVPQTVPDAEAEEIAGLLREVGVGDSRVTRVGFKVSEPHVRYYSPADAPAAASLAEMIGTEARDHTSFRPRPPDGTLEIFLAGDRSAPTPRATVSNRARPQQPDELSRMRDRIVNRLRRGEHL